MMERQPPSLVIAVKRHHQQCWFTTKRQRRAAAAATATNNDTAEQPTSVSRGSTNEEKCEEEIVDPSSATTLMLSPNSIVPIGGGDRQDDNNNNSWRELTEQENKRTIFDASHLQDLYNPSLHLPSAPTDWSGYEAPTPLFKEIQAVIGVTGQLLSTARYMQMALLHLVHGYYSNAISRKQQERKTPLDDDFDEDNYDDHDDDDPIDHNTSAGNIIIGPSGDFVTAPEVSSVFGEALGIWFYLQWKKERSRRAA